MATALKFLTLMNPPKKYMKTRSVRRRRSMPRRSRSGRFVRTVATRRVRRSRRVRRNPPKMTPAMRKKISLAVKRSFRNRAAARKTVVRAIARRPAARRRVIRALTKFRPRRSVSRRSFGGSSILKLVSKDTLMLAGGAVLASVGTGFILNKIGSKLPLMTPTTPPATAEKARAVYSVVLPIGLAYLLRKKQPKIAEGLVIGGLIMGINSLIRSFAPGAAGAVVQGPMGNFYEVGRGMGLAGEIPVSGGAGLGEYVSGANPGSLATDLTGSAFAQSAW